MPTPLIRKLAPKYAKKKKIKVSSAITALENLWKKAKDIASGRFTEADRAFYPYTTKVFERMAGFASATPVSNMRKIFVSLSGPSAKIPGKRKGPIVGKKERPITSKPGKRAYRDRTGKGTPKDIDTKERTTGNKLPIWWKHMTLEGRREYLQQHPTSKMKKYLETDLPKDGEALNHEQEKEARKQEEQQHKIDREQEIVEQKLPTPEHVDSNDPNDREPTKEERTEFKKAGKKVQEYYEQNREKVLNKVADSTAPNEKKFMALAYQKIVKGQKLTDDEQQRYEQGMSKVLKVLYGGLAVASFAALAVGIPNPLLKETVEGYFNHKEKSDEEQAAKDKEYEKQEKKQRDQEEEFKRRAEEVKQQQEETLQENPPVAPVEHEMTFDEAADNMIKDYIQYKAQEK